MSGALARPVRGRGLAAGAAVLVALLLGAVAPALLLAAPPAAAHASLVGSTPTAEQSVARLPAEVVFEFSEEMSAPAYVVVTAPDGSSVTVGEPVVDGTQVRQAVEGDQVGAYTMAYRAVSVDGHPVTGQVSFTVATVGSVGAASDAPAAAPAPTTSPTPSPSDDPSPDAAGAASAQASGGSWVLSPWGAGVPLLMAILAGLLLLLARRSRP